MLVQSELRSGRLGAGYQCGPKLGIPAPLRHQRRQARQPARHQRLPLAIRATVAVEEPALASPQTEQLAPEPPTEGNLVAVYNRSRPTGKPRIVVLGTGWGAVSFLKSLKRNVGEVVDVTLVSPRNYFLYTPLLPAAATGTVEERSIVEPIRRILGKKGKFFEAVCQSIDPEEKSIVACFPEDAGMDRACFKVYYDYLVLGVGSVNNTFGIQGVAEHTNFFKGIRDANKLRRLVSECFERAALPQTPQQEREKLLSFVIVGGGPTGVEVAAELHDMVVDDLRKVYPDLIGDVHIRVIELQDHLLSTYDRAISTYTDAQFKRSGIDLVLNSKVQSVSKNRVQVNTNGVIREIPFGACVWATGVAMHPLVKQLQGKLPPGTQTHFRSIVTDEYLQVKGSGGTMFAIGDAATIEQEKAKEHATELFQRADRDGDGKVTMMELRELLKGASKDYPQLEEHSRFLEGKYGAKRWGGMVKNIVESSKKPTNGAAATGNQSVMGGLDEKVELSKETFEELLVKIDLGLRALPATAQVAKQQGEYLSAVLSSGKVRPGQPIPPDTPPFRYKHKGSLAYVGQDRAVMDVPSLGPLTGWGAGLAWKGFETYSQISFRNMVLVSTDWVRTKIFGRDISRV